MIRFLKKQPPGRLIALGFAAVILIGSALLMLPISIRPGVEVAYIDALFTSTSAVCVTGLIAVDAYDNTSEPASGERRFSASSELSADSGDSPSFESSPLGEK